MADFPTFLLLLTIAYVVPGPDFVLIFDAAVRSARLGRAAAAGVVSGLVLHAALATAGLSSLIAGTSWGLPVLRVAGGAFLLYLGVTAIVATLRSRDAPRRYAGPASARSAWRRGFLGNLLNPKTLLFFLALIPQLVDTREPVLPQVALLSSLTVLAGVAWWSLVVHAAAGLAPLMERPRLRRRVDLGAGVALVGLAGLVGLG